MQTTENKDEKIAKLIWHDSLQSSVKPFTWGLDFNSIRTIPNGTAFRTERKLKGNVSIEASSGLRYFNITIKPDNDRKPIVYKDVMLGNIVRVIDHLFTQAKTQEKPVCIEYGLVPERIAV